MPKCSSSIQLRRQMASGQTSDSQWQLWLEDDFEGLELESTQWINWCFFFFTSHGILLQHATQSWDTSKWNDFSWFHVGLCQWQYLEPGTIWHSHFPWVLCSVPLWRGIRVVAVQIDQIVQARRAKREAEARQAKARTSQRMEVLNLVNMTGGRAHPDILKRFISLKWLVIYIYIWYIYIYDIYIWYIYNLYNRYIDVGSPCSWDLNGWARLARMATRNKEMT